MANMKIYVGILITALVVGVLFTGCEINFNYDPEDELILDSGYAWVTDNDHVNIDFDWFEISIGIDNGDDYGYVFKPNGRVDLIEKDGSHWEWVSTSRYSIKDNDHIKIGSKTFDFEIDDGDELYLDGVYFERKWVGNIIVY